MHSLGATAVSRRSHLRLPTVFVAEFHNLFRVGSNEDICEERRRSHCFVDHSNQRLASDFAQHLAGQTGRSQTGRDDGDRLHGQYRFS